MEAEVKTITINGIDYVQKDSTVKEEIVENYVIVRTESAGVHAGEIVSKNGVEIKLKNARRLWYWDGAASLSQLAVDGVSKPENCKFPCEVSEIFLRWIEIIPCTKTAIESIKGVKIWKR